MIKKGKTFFRDSLFLLKNSFSEFNKDKVLKLSAALAYYTIFSLPSMLIVIIGLCSIFYGKEAIQGQLFHQIDELVGADAAKQIQDILTKTTMQHDNFLATTVGLIILLISATGMFGEIQDSINTIWGLKTKPKKGFVSLLLNRLMSFSMILILGFILLVSLLLNAVMASIFTRLKYYFSESIINGLYFVDHLVILVITSTLFAFIFKVLPDAKVLWKDVLMSSIVTSLLFMIGKFLIGLYMENNASISTYGASGSLIVLLLWVYYSAIILYFGAEFTHIYIKYKGRKIEPSNYAEVVEKYPADIPVIT